ncbi:hypothetical protein ACIQRS_28950 [Streptomyces termitum]|uniref:Uncharacterized protein n=1 Tax=Streptomyces termitum TaxID=67368 RepID=A0A918W5L2_9ACTN|nr:hypothetical protein [Streptomyces termitum]GHA71029.1 hypothetical protein GCM10010305_11880 [Streptomyces termitum]
MTDRPHARPDGEAPGEAPGDESAAGAGTAPGETPGAAAPPARARRFEEAAAHVLAASGELNRRLA